MLRLIEEGYKLDERVKARAEYGLAIEMKVRTGARLGELLGVRYGDIDFEQGVWTIKTQWTPEGELVDYVKTAKSARRVPIAPPLLRKIAARKLRFGAGEDDFIHAAKKGRKPYSHSNFRKRAWNLAVENAGLTDGPKVTPHDARHAFASEMADLGLSSADVGEVLGHTTAGITEKIYLHASTATSARSASGKRRLERWGVETSAGADNNIWSAVQTLATGDYPCHISLYGMNDTSPCRSPVQEAPRRQEPLQL